MNTVVVMGLKPPEVVNTSGEKLPCLMWSLVLNRTIEVCPYWAKGLKGLVIINYEN